MQYQQLLLRAELPSVRAAASAWRNGLAALLAALVGFSLIKGRTDISLLAPPWATVVGVLLLLALSTGVGGALALLRACHGRPKVVALRDLPSRPKAEHDEALASVRALRLGIGMTLGCTALLVAAVGVTWYGPSGTDPQLRVSHDGTISCGTVDQTAPGSITLKTTAGEVTIELATMQALEPVDSCPAR